MEIQQKTDQSQINRVVWKACDTFRGVIDPSQYKDYILTMLFLKYVSDVYKAKYSEYLNRYEGDKERAARSMRHERFLIPETSSFDYLYQHRTADNIGELIDMALADIEDANREKMSSEDGSSIFRNISFNSANLGEPKEKNPRLKNLLVDFSELELDESHLENNDIIGDAYMYLVSTFASESGKKAGEFFTPAEVSTLLAKLTKSKPGARICDPTCGSGSLLLTVQDEVPGGTNTGAVKFYGQELNTTTYNLARMNLMMHGVSFQNMNLSNADTLEIDWPDGPDEKGVDHPRSFDAVVANPPYSAHWDNSESKLKDARFKDYGKLAPKTKADYSFVLHGLYHLNEEGTMAIVLPHGVLFRGAAEGTIRQNLIEHPSGNHIYAIIGLPSNLFYGTSIPTIVMVLKKKRTSKDILFIDASNEFEKGKNQNRLSDNNIEKIISTYRERKDVPKYAHLASIEEIRQNDYNLNIPRYVDTSEEEEEIDINEVRNLLTQDKKEIAELEAQIDEQFKLLGL